MEDYTVIRAIGKGSFGKVYLVRHAREGRSYVMKVIKLKGIPPKEREACRNEVMLMQRLQHPNIVAYKDSFFANGRDNLCIVMTYCDGGDLAARLAAAKAQLFKEDQIMHWFVQIALAIHYMHENKVLHRDIKTQNIFLLGNGRLVLGDLGISKVLDGPVSFASTQIGTPYYMSPELFKSKPYNHKSDVWALGCVLYELCTLQHPFDATSLNGLAQKIARGAYTPINAKYSQSLRALIASMLAIAPASRPSMADILTQPYIKKHVYNFLKDIAQRSATALGAGDAPVGEGTMMFKAAALKVAGPASGGSSDAMTRAVAAGLGPHAVNLQSQLVALGLQPVVMKALEDAASGSTADFFSAPATAPAPAATSKATPAAVARATPAALIGASAAPPPVAAPAVSAPASTAAAPVAAAGDARNVKKIVKEQQAALDREEERRRAVEQALAKLREEKELRAKQRDDFRRKQERMGLRPGLAAAAAAAPPQLPPHRTPIAAAPSPAAFGALPPGKVKIIPVGAGLPAGVAAKASVAAAPASAVSAGVRGRAVPLSASPAPAPPTALGASPSVASLAAGNRKPVDAPPSARSAASAAGRAGSVDSDASTAAPGARDAAARKADMEKKRVAELDAWERDRVQRAHAKAVGISALHAASPAPAGNKDPSPSARGPSRGKERTPSTGQADVASARSSKASPAAAASAKVTPATSAAAVAAAADAERSRRAEADRQARVEKKAREDARWAAMRGEEEAAGACSDTPPPAPGLRAVPSTASVGSTASGIAARGVAGKRDATAAQPSHAPASAAHSRVASSSSTSSATAAAPPLAPAVLARNPSAASIASSHHAHASKGPSPSAASAPGARVTPPATSESPVLRSVSVPTGASVDAAVTTSFSLDAYLPDNYDSLGAKEKVLARKDALRRAEEEKQRSRLQAAAMEGHTDRRRAQYLAREQYRGVGAAIAGALPIHNHVLEESVADASDLVATLSAQLPGARYADGDSKLDGGIPEEIEHVRGGGRRARPDTAGSELPSDSKLRSHSSQEEDAGVADLDTTEPYAGDLNDTDPAMMTAISEDSDLGAPAMPTPCRGRKRPQEGDDAETETADEYAAGELPDTDSEDSVIMAAAAGGDLDTEDEEEDTVADEEALKLHDASVGAGRATGVRVVSVRGKNGTVGGAAAASRASAAPTAAESAVPEARRRRPHIGLDNGDHDDADIRAAEEQLRSELMRSTLRCNNLRASLEVARKFMMDVSGGMPTHMRASVSGAARSTVPMHAADGGAPVSSSVLAAMLPKPAYGAAAAPRDDRPLRPSAHPAVFGGGFGEAPPPPAPVASAALKPSPSAGDVFAPVAGAVRASVLAPSAAAAAAAGGYLAPRPVPPAQPSLPPASAVAPGGVELFSGPTPFYSPVDEGDEDLYDDDLGDEDGDMEGGIDFRHMDAGATAIPEETDADVANERTSGGGAAVPPEEDDDETPSFAAPVEFKSHLEVDMTPGYAAAADGSGGGEYVDLPTRMERLRKKCIVGLGAPLFDDVYMCVKTQMDDEDAGTLDLSDVRVRVGHDKQALVEDVVHLLHLEQTFL